MGAKYKQLDMEERIEIARRRSSGETLRQIATALDRTASSIAREVKRNSAQTGRYHPIYADQQARARRWSGSKLSRDIVLQERVLGLLRQGLSPQMVCGRLQYEQGKAVLSYESIYRFIAAQIARTKDYRWRHYLPNAKSKRGWRGRKGGSSVERIAKRVSIHERDAQVQTRIQAGHWEADLLLFRLYGQAVLALHERTSRLTLLFKQASKAAQPIVDRISEVLSQLPWSLRRSITFDNGTEFAYHHQLKDTLGIHTYFCDPRSPWQKGGVENAIGRIRKLLPRQTNLDTLRDEDLLNISRYYNHMPRKCLNFQTPAEVFLRLLHFKCESTFPLSRE